MGSTNNTKIFISYARKDGAQLAQRLQKGLTDAGFDAWLDTRDIQGGRNWIKEIQEQIDSREVLLALVSPGSCASKVCDMELVRAWRKGKRLVPLLLESSETPLLLEGAQYINFTPTSPYNVRFQELLAAIEGGATAALKEKYRTTPVSYITTPPTVVNYIERPEALQALRDALFAEHSRGPLALTALAGMGGIGKTVLANALTRDRVVHDAFPDGIVWITIGKEQTADLLASFREIGKVLGYKLKRNDTLSAAVNQYKTELAQKAVLIVVDDVWKKSDLEPFLADSERGRLLFTTRDASIARFIGAREQTADLLDLDQARELLAAWAGLPGFGSTLPSAVIPSPARNVDLIDALIEQCGKLPLALSVIGAMLRGAMPEEWDDTLRLLREADLSAITDRLPPGQESFFRAVEVSFKALAPEMQERYKALAVLLEDMAAPLPTLQTLWGVNEPEARGISRHFVDRSLAQREGEPGSIRPRQSVIPEEAGIQSASNRDGIRLHDLQLDYVRAQYPDREALDLIHGAVRLSSHVIERDAKQFASQMVGRLLLHQELPRVRQFTESMTKGAPRPWLRPLWPTLHPPGTALVCTLSGHSHWVRGVAVSGDGRRAVSASSDRTLKVWDLETGRELRTLSGHSGGLRGVAVSGDGRRAVSASEDRTLKVWDLDTGRELNTLSGHSDGVNSVAMSGDGRRAVSASSDQTLKVWDLEAGRELNTLSGHSGYLMGVAVSWDERRAVSASSSGTLKVWELETGRELRTLSGHSGWVMGVAVSGDGRRAVSASGDRTLKVWNLETGRELRTLFGHSGWVFGVAVSGDGRRAVSTSDDRMLKVWNLETGPELRNLSGHSNEVIGVAVSGDGRRAISASYDQTLKVWDLDSGPQLGLVLRTLSGHSRSVNGVAVSGDGRRAVSTSDDRTLKVWDPEAGRQLRTLSGHSDWVNGVAITGDGRRAVSASRDRTLRVWDLESRRQYASAFLRGHSGPVNGVAMSGDGRRAVSVSDDRTLKVWDLQTDRELRTLSGHSGGVNEVGLTVDGRRAVSASSDQTLKVWDLETGQEMRTLAGHSGGVLGVAVSGDGRRAVSASSDQTLMVWDLETGTVIATFTCDAAALCCAFAGDHKLVAGDASGRVHFLQLEL